MAYNPNDMMTMSDRQFFTGSFGGGNPYYNAPTTTPTAPMPASNVPMGTGLSTGAQNIFGMDASTANSLFGSVGPNGAINPGAVQQVAGLGSALAQSWLGFQQYNLAQDAFSFQKDAFNKQFALSKDAYDVAKTNQTSTAAAQNA